MLYTTVLLEDEPSTKARLMTDLEQWMTLGQTHLQGSFAAFYLAAHKHNRRRLEESDGALHIVAKGTVQALLLDMASMEGDLRFRDIRTNLLAGATEALMGLAAKRETPGDPRASAGVVVGMLAHVANHQHGLERWGVSHDLLVETVAGIIRRTILGVA